MNIRILLALAALLSIHTVPCRASDDVFWWRLDQETAPYQSVVGESPLHWWSDTKTPEASSTEVPPSTLYRHPATPPLSVFDSGKSHQGDCALQLKQGGAAFSNVETGLTVEGFFRTTPLKSEHERQALVSCGEGYADIAWIVFLRDGHPVLAVYREGSHEPAASLELPADVRDGQWHFFVARISPELLSLSVSTASGKPLTGSTTLPDGFAIRKSSKPLLVGRSSIYIDNAPYYRGSRDTFGGQLCDIRITRSNLPDTGLLGMISK
ncbi:MAG: hypothetical protein RL630_315 [Verrucomicrobiota bacterium]|jgi:hypothetical protein